MVEFLIWSARLFGIYLFGTLCGYMLWDIWEGRDRPDGGDVDEELLLKDANKPWWF